ncbi:putative GYF-like domain-containing protein [Lupinus albus]|uniref:Putative GYF-like domain-containing protein n=1 Tax=Lupinus albus TaxID=3870 RepID=A0A6A4MR35_LUPAL|nr:putative GYF-like domain-containing protein [Lupinus albus]
MFFYGRLQNLIFQKIVENNLQELWKTTSKRASLVTEVPKAVANAFLWKATIPDVPEDLELEFQTPNVPDKRVENNLQELWKTTSKRASLVTEVPKAVADVFLGKATKPDVPKDLESESLTPDVPDKRVENNLQELWKTTSQASLVTEVPKAVADVFLWKATKPNVPQDLNLESPTSDVPDKRVENNLQESWKTTSKQASLVSEVPKAVADGFLWKATKLDIADLVKEENNSPKSTLGLRGASEVPPFTMEMKGTMLNVISRDTAAAQQSSVMPFQQKPKQQIDLNIDLSDAAESYEAEISQGLEDKPVKPSQPEVIELSDDDEEEEEEDEEENDDEEPKSTTQVDAEVLQSLMWYYRDPQGSVQGPFSLTSLKRWSEENYFPPNFMVWKTGQSQYEAALLVNILHQFFPS